MKKILIGGVGNIFFGDDAFGCEVVKLLQTGELPSNVKLEDFGIRTRDLAYELCNNYDLVILIDAVKTSESSGTISLLEIDEYNLSDDFQSNSHEFKIEESLKFAQKLGAEFGKIYLVGCEAESLEKLSETVKKSVVKAAEIVKNLCK